jgi:hypothetical protein
MGVESFTFLSTFSQPPIKFLHNSVDKPKKRALRPSALAGGLAEALAFF